MGRRALMLLAGAMALIAAPVDGATTGVNQAKSVNMTLPSPFTGSFTYVPQLACGDYTGSSVRISDDLLLTAHHMIDGAPCTTHGQSLTVVMDSPGADFSVLRLTKPEGGFRVIASCEGIREGDAYLAYGYALGLDGTVTRLTGTGDNLDNGQVYMIGRVYPGQSGGPVLNDRSEVVAVVSAYLEKLSVSIVTPLSATALCKNGRIALK